MITAIILLSIIVALIAIVIVCAPFSITIRTSKIISYEIQIGDCMPDVWVCSYWLAIMKTTQTPEDFEYPEYWQMIFRFWEMSSGKYINGKTTSDEPDEHQLPLDEQMDADFKERHPDAGSLWD